MDDSPVDSPIDIPDRKARPSRVLIVGRRPIERVGIQGLLEEQGDLTVVGQASSPEDARDFLAQAAPDVVLAAWDDRDDEEFAALAEAAQRAGAPLILIGEPLRSGDLAALLQLGVRGFLSPDASGEDITAAVHAAGRGFAVLEPVVAQALAPRPPVGWPEEAPGEEPLTDREGEVLQLVAQGLPNKVIAIRLGISEHTVKFHVGSILAKLDASSRTEAVMRAARRGMLTL
ncbi:MAG: DNA-binding response regulator [Chloroflexi bacterium]|nr:DNA-binding response regulator [Chloroflexota bacterium]